MSIESIRKGCLFREKWYILKGKGLNLGAVPLRINICGVLPLHVGANYYIPIQKAISAKSQTFTTVNRVMREYQNLTLRSYMVNLEILS